MNVVYTIGYEGSDIDQFVATLKAVGIEVLADVRAVAGSRKKGFSKSALKARLETLGIRYVHFADLGDPKPGRDAARAGRYALFKAIYNKHLNSAQPLAALEALSEVAFQEPTCLLCFERNADLCHRSIVGRQLKARGLEVFNLFADDPDRYTRHDSKLPRFHPRQGASAA